MNIGANEPIADNELGTVARYCALEFCETKDALGLWMALQDICEQVQSVEPSRPDSVRDERDCAEYLCPDASNADRAMLYIQSGCQSVKTNVK